MPLDPPALRLFVALWPCARSRAALAERQRGLHWPAAARRVAAAGLHLTLAFIGAVPAGRLDAVRSATTLPSFDVALVLDRFELWNGGTVVLRPSTVPDVLIDLQARLVASLQAAALPCDRRPFVPHVTLGRKAKGLDCVGVAPVCWRSTGQVLARSVGGRYSAVARSLAG